MAGQSGPVRLVPGQLMHDFALPALDGRQVSLTAYRGRGLIVFMWASW